MSKLRRQTKTILDAAADAGVRFIVHLGIFGYGRLTYAYGTWHEIVERYIEGRWIIATVYPVERKIRSIPESASAKVSAWSTPGLHLRRFAGRVDNPNGSDPFELSVAPIWGPADFACSLQKRTAAQVSA
jgi:hypothetical protein